VEDDNIHTLEEGGAFERVGANLYGRKTINSHPTFDDIYIATGPYAQARVEVGNAPVYEDCTKIAIGVVESWSDTDIDFTYYEGNFDDTDQKYLFIVNADGIISNAKAVSFLDEGACAEGLISSACSCNGDEYTYGYCCANQWNPAACDGRTWSRIYLQDFESYGQNGDRNVVTQIIDDDPYLSTFMHTAFSSAFTIEDGALKDNLKADSTDEKRAHRVQILLDDLGVDPQGEFFLKSRLKFDPNNNWQCVPDEYCYTNDRIKMNFAFGDNDDAWVAGISPSYDGELAIYRNLDFGNNVGDCPAGSTDTIESEEMMVMSDGNYHEWIWYFKHNTGYNPDGIFQWYVDGNIAKEHHDIMYQPDPVAYPACENKGDFSRIDKPVTYWGGGSIPLNDWWFWIDDVEIWVPEDTIITPPCAEGAFRDCGATDVGACEFGEQTCSDGVWGSCNDGNVHFWNLASSSGNLDLLVEDDNIHTLEEGGAFERVGANLYGRKTINSHPTFDDIYIATGPYAQARVEVGNAPVYEDCTKIAIGVVESWSDTDIDFTYYEGNFDDTDQKYLFIVNADGIISNAKAVSFLDEGACAEGLISSACSCNGDEYTYGYCCANQWNPAACDGRTWSRIYLQDFESYGQNGDRNVVTQIIDDDPYLSTFMHTAFSSAFTIEDGALKDNLKADSTDEKRAHRVQILLDDLGVDPQGEFFLKSRLKFDPNNNWQCVPDEYCYTNDRIKMNFAFGDNDDAWVAGISPSYDGELAIYRNLDFGNNVGDCPAGSTDTIESEEMMVMSDGNYHEWIWYFKHNTGYNPDGIFQWYVDGNIAKEHHDIMYQPDPVAYPACENKGDFSRIDKPVTYWGGGSIPLNDWWFWIDDVEIWVPEDTIITPPCAEGAFRDCGATDVGACEFGEQTCSDGVWGSCIGEIVAVVETASMCEDNIDQDCDGSDLPCVAVSGDLTGDGDVDIFDLLAASSFEELVLVGRNFGFVS